MSVLAIAIAILLLLMVMTMIIIIIIIIITMMIMIIITVSLLAITITIFISNFLVAIQELYVKWTLTNVCHSHVRMVVHCVDEVSSSFCRCSEDFYNSTCSSDVSKCLSNPCFNGGSCQYSGTRFQLNRTIGTRFTIQRCAIVSGLSLMKLKLRCIDADKALYGMYSRTEVKEININKPISQSVAAYQQNCIP